MPSVTWDNFAGGLHVAEADSEQRPGFAVPEGALLVAENVEVLPSGAIRGRRGRVPFGESFGHPVTGMHRHYPREGIVTSGPRECLGSGGGGWAPADALSAVGVSAATTTLGAGDVSGDLHLYQFGFTLEEIVPPGETVLGVRLRLLRRASPNGLIRDASVRLRIGGVAVGDDLAHLNENWPETYTLTAYGNAAETWGVALTPSMLNDVPDFGFVVAVRNAGSIPAAAQIDYAQLIVYHTGTIAPVMLVAVPSTVQRYFILDDTGTPTIMPALATAIGSRPRFVSWPEQNATFIFDGVNEPVFFTGRTLAKLEKLGDLEAPRGPYAALWRNRLWATRPEEQDFSVYASEINSPSDWPADLQLSCNDPDGGRITGIVPVVDRLLILKQTALFSFSGVIGIGGQLEQFSTRGCVAPDTVALTPYGVLFLGRDGLYLTDGRSPEPMEVSMAIRPVLAPRAGETAWPDAFGAYYRRRDQYWLKLAPDLPDGWVLQRLQVATEAGIGTIFAWTHVSSLPMNAACTWDGGEDEGQIFVADSTGQIRRADVGKTDDGEPYACEIVTSARPLAPGLNLGRAYHAKLLVRSQAALVGGIRYDHELTDSVDFAVANNSVPLLEEPRITLVDLERFGRFVSVHLHNPSDGYDFELHRVWLDTLVRSARRWP